LYNPAEREGERISGELLPRVHSAPTASTESEGMDNSDLNGSPPLRIDEGGVVRVGLGRVSLDLIVEQYENGMTLANSLRETKNALLNRDEPASDDDDPVFTPAPNPNVPGVIELGRSQTNGSHNNEGLVGQQLDE
jgi:hypothetical protein